MLYCICCDSCVVYFIHLEVLSLDRSLIPLGFLLSIALLIIGGIFAARANHNIDFLFKKVKIMIKGLKLDLGMKSCLKYWFH